MKLSYAGIQNREAYQKAGIRLPAYDWRRMAQKTMRAPVWVHFGAGNIFRGYIAALQQRLLEAGQQSVGIIAAETFDFDIITRVYEPHDSMSLVVTLQPDGRMDKEIVASIARGVRACCAETEQWNALRAVFESSSLQMASFTITEKGYALRDIHGGITGTAMADMAGGPDKALHAMGVAAAMLYYRYLAGGAPIAMVSMDNCSHNGEKLRAGMVEIARAWRENGLVPADYVTYVEDEARVSFPWSMIDKITPRPAQAIRQQLEALGMEDMAPTVTGRNTYIAPFVNTEAPQYLVVEDRFPNGRPALEQAGVYMTTREVVNMTERMKVTTCLNPLHTALAVYGCLLGYRSIAQEMRDPELKALVERIGYAEGLPVVTDPGIISPRAFINEVVERRLPNPFIPDTPQRIATDTSQKVGIRYGETLKSYMAREDLNPAGLTAIPLALAGWLRYLLATDDNGLPMPVSADPMLTQLQDALKDVRLGFPETALGVLAPILRNASVFGVDLYQAGVAQKVETLFEELIAGPGAVRQTLKKYLCPAL